MNEDIDIKDNKRINPSYRLKPEILNLFKSSLLVPLGVVSTVNKIDISKYLKWLSLKYNGSLKYLENNLECRQDPSYILKDVKTIIPVILPYAELINRSKLIKKEYKDLKVSCYSFIKDYHLIIKSELRSVVEGLISMIPGIKTRVVVDSAPIFEKYNASLTNEGVIGKNSLFIHKKYGSFIFLGEILTTAEVNSFIEKANDYKCNTCNLCDSYENNKICSDSCSSCIKGCPTGAITSDGIDVCKCLSYLTIEHSGSVDEKYWKYFKNSFFGCDLCQTKCVYNKKIIGLNKNDNDSNASDRDKDNIGIDIDKYLLSKEQLSYLSEPYKILFMKELEFKKVFKETSFLRAGYKGITRNILIHLAVNKDPRFISIISDPNINPLVWSYISDNSLVSQYKS